MYVPFSNPVAGLGMEKATYLVPSVLIVAGSIIASPSFDADPIIIVSDGAFFSSAVI